MKGVVAKQPKSTHVAAGDEGREVLLAESTLQVNSPSYLGTTVQIAKLLVLAVEKLLIKSDPAVQDNLGVQPGWLDLLKS